MRVFLLASVVSLPFVLLAGCGDDEGVGGGGGGTTSAATTSSTSSSTATTVASTTTGPPSDITPTITVANLSANCMPAIPADPVTGTIDVTYDNAGDMPGTLTISSATLTLIGQAGNLSFSFSLDPHDSGSVGAFGSVGVPHTKVDGSGSGGQPCDFCGAQGTLSITWVDDMGGSAQDSVAIPSFSCVQ